MFLFPIKSPLGWNSLQGLYQILWNRETSPWRSWLDPAATQYCSQCFPKPVFKTFSGIKNFFKILRIFLTWLELKKITLLFSVNIKNAQRKICLSVWKINFKWLWVLVGWGKLICLLFSCCFAVTSGVYRMVFAPTLPEASPVLACSLHNYLSTQPPLSLPPNHRIYYLDSNSTR